MRRGPGGGARHQAGLAAEEAAAAAYEAMGGAVLARRARTPAGEIDLVVRLGAIAVVVEVKARRRAGPDSPVSPRQWARISAAAELWMAEHAPEGIAGLRFDAALVDAAGGVEILADAHRPAPD